MNLFEEDPHTQRAMDWAREGLSKRERDRQYRDRQASARNTIRDRESRAKELAAQAAAKNAETRAKYYELHRSQASNREAGSGAIRAGSDTSASATLKMIQPISKLPGWGAKQLRNLALRNKKYAAMERLAAARGKNPKAYGGGRSRNVPATSSNTQPTPPPEPTTPSSSTPQSVQRGPTPPKPPGIIARRQQKPLGPKFGGFRGMSGKNNTTEQYEYSCWREEFIVELRDLRAKKRKKNEDEKIDKMRGKNNITLHPTVSAESSNYGKLIETTNGASIFAKATPPVEKRTTPLSDIVLSKQPGRGTAEKVEKTMRKLFLGDRSDFYPNYDLSLTKKAQDNVNEAYDDDNETFRQHSRERFTAGPGDDEHQRRAARTARFLKRMAEMNKDVPRPKKKKKKKKKEGDI